MKQDKDKVLQAIYDDGYINRSYLFTILRKKYPDQVIEVDHILKYLEENNDIVNDEGKIHLTLDGYKLFDPWYMKGWRLITNDVAKALSIIATSLSIFTILNK